MTKKTKKLPKLSRRRLKTLQTDAGKPFGSPTYLNPVANAGGTTRDIPTTHYTMARPITGQ